MKVGIYPLFDVNTYVMGCDEHIWISKQAGDYLVGLNYRSSVLGRAGFGAFGGAFDASYYSLPVRLSRAVKERGVNTRLHFDFFSFD